MRLVDKPRNQKILGSKWVFKKKQEVAGNGKLRFKARLVAQGFTHRDGIDFAEIFSPAVKHKSIRFILSLVAKLDMELEQMDVKTAFLYGELKETIFMKQPQGFEVKGDEDKGCLLKKSLYGLKQSPRQWNKRFDQFMIKNKFSRSRLDNCIYFKEVSSDCMIFLLLYVDDILMASKSMIEIHKLKQALRSEFDMKDLGPTKKILGMEIRRDRTAKKLFLTQTDYLEKVLARFGMKNSKPVLTPLSTQFKIKNVTRDKSEEEKLFMSKIPYASVMGSLMYAMVCTRPDLSYAVSLLSRYMVDPWKDY